MPNEQPQQALRAHTWPAWNGLPHKRISAWSGQQAPQSHLLVALGVAAGHKVRYFTAADLVETRYRAAWPTTASAE
jgi:hypothetical protein